MELIQNPNIYFEEHFVNNKYSESIKLNSNHKNNPNKYTNIIFDLWKKFEFIDIDQKDLKESFINIMNKNPKSNQINNLINLLNIEKIKM